MNVYTYSEARQNLAKLLDQVLEEGEVCIKRKDGQVFIIKPKLNPSSPLDVKGIDLDMDADDILQFVQAGRRYSEGFGK